MDQNSIFYCLLYLQLIPYSTVVAETSNYMDSCFKHNAEQVNPKCTWETILPLPATNTNTTALPSSVCVKPGVARVQGNYGVIRLFCIAPYALEFEYDGVQPNEAIVPLYGKHFSGYVDGLRVFQFSMDVQIYSSESLFQYFQNQSSSPIHRRPDYSRTGNYSVFGMFNRTLRNYVYIFLEEDNETPALIRNSNTVSPKAFAENRILLPCRSTHFYSEIYIMIEGNLTQEIIAHEATFLDSVQIGYVIEIEKSEEPQNYSCNLYHNGEIVDSLIFTFPKPKYDVKIFYGFEDLPIQSKDLPLDLVSLKFENKIINGTPLLFPRCSSGPFPGGNKLNRISASINGHNEARSRLIKEFISPKHNNKSYMVRFGVLEDENNDYISILQMPKGFGAGLIASFCQGWDIYKLSLFTIGTNAVSQAYPYDQDFFKVTNWSAVSTDLYMKVVGVGLPDRTIYTNTTLSFACHLHTLGVVWPIIWYSERTDSNGSWTEEFIDYYDASKDLGTSYFSIFATKDIKKVWCSTSTWFGAQWKNVSIALHLTEGEMPQIVNKSQEIYNLRLSALNQIIKCVATGDPFPTMWWERNGENVSTPTVPRDRTVILEFPSVRKSDGGEYICHAHNIYGRSLSSFVVENGDTSYGIIVGASLLVVFLITVMIYAKFLKKQNEYIGLTKREIKEFLEGDRRVSNIKGDYYNEIAEKRPYNAEVEIAAGKLEIDEENVLGSGAFGVVYKGVLDGRPVAVKTIKQKDAGKGLLKALLSELKIMAYIGEHEYIIQLLGAVTKDLKKGILYIIVPLCSGNLLEYLRQQRNLRNITFKYQNALFAEGEVALSVDYLIEWARQIAAGMKYLGNKKVIHGDLACRNVLLDDNKIAKITDFGLSRQLYGYAEYVKKNQEPLPWRHMAPESIRNMTFSPQSDVWSYGVALYELFTLGEVPYPGIVWSVNFIEQLESGMRMKKPKHLQDHLYVNIMLECWRNDPKERITFREIESKLEEEKRNLMRKCSDDGEINYFNF